MRVIKTLLLKGQSILRLLSSCNDHTHRGQNGLSASLPGKSHSAVVCTSVGRASGFTTLGTEGKENEVNDKINTPAIQTSKHH